MRFLWDVVIPLSRTNMAALFVITFLYGWNQYLWPLLVTTDEAMYTTVIGIKRMITGGDDEHAGIRASRHRGTGGVDKDAGRRSGARGSGERSVNWRANRRI